MYKFLILAAACALAQSIEYGGYQKEAQHEDYYTEPHYAFEYAVHDPHTGDIHSQKEERKGDSTHGEYSLVEADGSKRRVQYSIEGKSGFLAHVERDHNQHGYAKPNAGYYKASAQEQSYQQASGYKSSTGYKVAGPSYSQSSSYSSSSYKQPSPSYYKPAPAYQPAPVYHQPAPLYHEPAPAYHQPAPIPVYHQPAPAYHQPAPAYKPSYGGSGAATSSVSISTHGAKITTSTKHIIPAKPHHY